MILKSDSPLDLRLTITSGQLFHWSEDKGLFKIVQDGTFLYARQSAPCEIEIEQAGEEMGSAELTDLFGLKRRRKGVFEKLEEDRLLGELIPVYKGLTIMRQHPYECLISFMASAMSNIPRIMRNLRDLRAQAGTRITGTEERSFPSPEQIVELDERGLRRIGLGYRAKFISATCTLLAKECIQLSDWSDKDTPELTDGLIGFPGVGRKIAECVALFSFGRWDAFPVDVWVKRALSTLNPKLRGMSADDLCEWGKERWGSSAGLAQQILFCAARDGRISR